MPVLQCIKIITHLSPGKLDLLHSKQLSSLTTKQKQQRAWQITSPHNYKAQLDIPELFKACCTLLYRELDRLLFLASCIFQIIRHFKVYLGIALDGRPGFIWRGRMSRLAWSLVRRNFLARS